MLTALPHTRHHRFSYIKGNHPPNIPRFFLSSPESPTTFAPFVPRHSIALFLPTPPLFGATPICGSRLQIRLRFLGLRLLPQATIRLRCCAIGHRPIRATGASISAKYDAPSWATPICGSRLQIRLRFELRLLPQAPIRLRCCAIGHSQYAQLARLFLRNTTRPIRLRRCSFCIHI